MTIEHRLSTSLFTQHYAEMYMAACSLIWLTDFSLCGFAMVFACVAIKNVADHAGMVWATNRSLKTMIPFLEEKRLVSFSLLTPDVQEHFGLFNHAPPEDGKPALYACLQVTSDYLEPHRAFLDPGGVSFICIVGSSAKPSEWKPGEWFTFCHEAGHISVNGQRLWTNRHAWVLCALLGPALFYSNFAQALMPIYGLSFINILLAIRSLHLDIEIFADRYACAIQRNPEGIETQRELLTFVARRRGGLRARLRALRKQHQARARLRALSSLELAKTYYTPALLPPLTAFLIGGILAGWCSPSWARFFIFGTAVVFLVFFRMYQESMRQRYRQEIGQKLGALIMDEIVNKRASFLVDLLKKEFAAQSGAIPDEQLKKLATDVLKGIPSKIKSGGPHESDTTEILSFLKAVLECIAVYYTWRLVKNERDKLLKDERERAERVAIENEDAAKALSK